MRLIPYIDSCICINSTYTMIDARIAAILVIREASEFMGLGGRHIPGGAKNFGHVAKGGRRFLDASRRGGKNFWTRREGGAKNFRLDLEFFKVCENNFKTIYICF